MLIWSGFRPQVLGTIINDGPGGMETIRDMRVELLHPDLYATPATENEVIAGDRWLVERQHVCCSLTCGVGRGARVTAVSNDEKTKELSNYM